MPFNAMIKYFPAPDIDQRARHISEKLAIMHDFSRVAFIRSRGSQARRTIARCHALPRIMQVALGVKGQYVIEVISEEFDSMSEEEQIKTLIHELMHIPKSMGGGFRYHDYVCRRNIEQLYERYRAA